MGGEKRDFRESLVVSEREKQIKGTKKGALKDKHSSNAGTAFQPGRKHELERQTKRLRGRLAERKSN